MQALTVWAKCSSPASSWSMMCSRRLWKSVQLEALVTWVWGRCGLIGSLMGGPGPPHVPHVPTAVGAR